MARAVVTWPETADAYMQRAADLCETRPLVDAVGQLVAERRQSIVAEVLANGPDALASIAREVGEQLDASCPSSEKATACLGGEIGFLLGLAEGLRLLAEFQRRLDVRRPCAERDN